MINLPHFLCIYIIDNQSERTDVSFYSVTLQSAFSF